MNEYNTSYLQLVPEVELVYHRVLSDIPNLNEVLEENCLSAHDVLKAHFLIANHFYLEGRNLAGIGPKSIDIFLSAIHRQVVSFDGKRKWPGKFEVCATLFYGLIQNHAFHDANKRTAFLSALLQLQRMGLCPAVSEKQFEDFTVEIASRQLDKYKRFRKYQSDGDKDAEVRFISHYLRKNTRAIDNRNRTVTYKELDVILKRHGYELGERYHNTIEILKVTKERTFLGGEKTTRRKITQVGFPRETAQVSQSDLKKIREATKLTFKDGVDSTAFFEGLDPLHELIASYNEPLKRLAVR